MTTLIETTRNDSAKRAILARQGLRLPSVTLKHLQRSGIYCQPTISIERQHLAKKWVLRGVECGGAVRELGAYSSFVDEGGSALPWLQRVDSIAVNSVHAVVVALAFVRVEMIRIERTYDLLLTRHALSSGSGRRPRLESSVLFYGRRGSLEVELWGKDAGLQGVVSPVFFSRSGERLDVPVEFQWAIVSATAAVCCLGCRHTHLLKANVTATAELC